MVRRGMALAVASLLGPGLAARVAAPAVQLTIASTCSDPGALALHPPGSPLLFVQGRNDGAGSTLINLIEATAFAYHQGYNFGGTVSCRHREKHHFSIDDAVEFMLGDPSAVVFNDVAEIDGLGGNGSSVGLAAAAAGARRALAAMGAFVLHRGARDGPANVTAVRVPGAPADADAWFDAPFVAALRRRVGCRAADALKGGGHFFAPDRATVAMHLRRGDVGAQAANRFDGDGEWAPGAPREQLSRTFMRASCAMFLAVVQRSTLP